MIKLRSEPNTVESNSAVWRTPESQKIPLKKIVNGIPLFKTIFKVFKTYMYIYNFVFEYIGEIKPYSKIRGPRWDWLRIKIGDENLVLNSI